jgi:hypothetical protein
MNDAFDAQPSVSMLLIFERFAGLDGGGRFTRTFTSEFRSPAKVNKHAFVGAQSVARR